MISSPNYEKQNEMFEWMKAVPYEVLRHERLYNAEELYGSYEPSDDKATDRASFAKCYDSRVYQHFVEQGKLSTHINESVARTVHDHSIHTALIEFLKAHDPKRCIGIMGGHAILRSDPIYALIAKLSQRLTESGFFMVTGGGPGAMEATHLGAWMAGRTEAELQDAVNLLATTAPSYKDWKWLSSALEVMRRYPQTEYVSLGIPTWLYGQEPATPLATHIAKYFVNSIREDTILSIAFGGIIYTPGSAGTLQEIFQNAVQNHYLSFGFASPMVFLGKGYWTEDVPAYSLIQYLIRKGIYKNLLLTLTDDIREIEHVLKDFQKTIPD